MNLLPYLVYKQLGQGELKPTSTTLLLASRSTNIPREVVENVHIELDKFYYPVDFILFGTQSVVNRTNFMLLMV